MPIYMYLTYDHWFVSNVQEGFNCEQLWNEKQTPSDSKNIITQKEQKFLTRLYCSEICLNWIYVGPNCLVMKYPIWHVYITFIASNACKGITFLNTVSVIWLAVISLSVHIKRFEMTHDYQECSLNWHRGMSSCGLPTMGLHRITFETVF